MPRNGEFLLKLLVDECVIWSLRPLQTFPRYIQGGNFTPASSQMQFIYHWCKNNVLELVSLSGLVVSLAGNQAAVGGFGSQSSEKAFALLWDLASAVISGHKLSFHAGPINLFKLYGGRDSRWVTVFSDFIKSTCCQLKIWKYSRILFFHASKCNNVFSLNVVMIWFPCSCVFCVFIQNLILHDFLFVLHI